MRNLIFDTDVFSDFRFHRLCAEVKDPFLATGKLIHAWMVANGLSDSEWKPIPNELWSEQSLGDELIQVGLAKKVEGGVLMVNPKEFFSEVTHA